VRLTTGLVTANRLMIQNAATAIAHHPRPAGGIKPYVRKNAEMVKKEVPKMDKAIHVTAAKIAEIAPTAAMEELAKLTTTITESCVGCHNLFRD
jgi:hypothetical protein